MKTISSQTNAGGPVKRNSGGFVATPTHWQILPQSRVATWLPAPAVARPKAARPAAQFSGALHKIWIPVGESIAEKGLLGLLAIGAVAAISYGFSGLLALVQNWAAVNSSIGRLIQ